MTHILKTGKTPATYDRRDVLFSSFRQKGTALEQAPIRFGHYKVLPTDGWSMLGNGPDDSVEPGFQGAGCCVLSDAGHATMQFNLEAGKPCPIITGKQTIADYSALTGYRIGDEQTDQGTNMRDALNYRRKTGILDAHGNRHKIGGFVALEPGNFAELLEAFLICDIVSVGIQFPQSAMDQFNAGKNWTYVKSSPNEGGHDILTNGRPTSQTIELVTWGRAIHMSATFYKHLCDEAYGLISQESLDAVGKNPQGFAWADMVAALGEFPS